MKSYSTLILAAFCAALTVNAQQSEAELLAVLKSDASRNTKVTAAHTLGQVGTKAAVAPLAELLSHAELAHAARYGLEQIPDPAVDEVFRAATGRLEGMFLVGVFQSIGQRRDAAAVPLLAKRLGDADKVIADAAADALGRIGMPDAAAIAAGKTGNADAAKALKPFLGKSEVASRAYLNCATGNPALYAEILQAGEAVPQSIRMAALRGELRARGLTRAAFEAKDPDAVDVALRVALEWPKSEDVDKMLVEVLRDVAPLRERLCAVIAERGASIPLDVLRPILSGNVPADQIAAMRAVTRVGMTAAIPDIAALIKSDAREVASEAQALLGCFPESPQRTAALNELLSSPDAKMQVIGIGVIANIRGKDSIPMLLKLTASADNTVSDAAFKVLGDISTLENLNALLAAFQAKPTSDAAVRAIMALCRQVSTTTAIEIRKAVYGNLDNDKQTADITEAVAAMVKSGKTAIVASNGLAGKDPAPNIVKSLQLTYAIEGAEKTVKVRENETVTFEDAGIPSAVLAPLNDVYAKSKGEAKSALLRVYSAFGNKQALDVICAAANQDADATLKEAAMRILFDSKSLATLPALEDILKQPASNERMKTLAIRAYTRLLNNSDLSAGARIAHLTKLSGILTRDDDRKAVAAAIATDMQAGQDEAGFKPMFNGKDLTGWDSRNGWWSARDGLLVAESTPEKKCEKNDHIIWTGGTPGDFEIRCDFRLTKSANSGIQVRAKNEANGDTGYQADMNGTGEYVGFLYHPAMHLVGGRGECTTLPTTAAPNGKDKEAWRFADSAALQKLYKVEDWNSYRVVCKGREITIYLNGVLTSHFTDNRAAMPKNGSITLQMHAGPPMKIEYRNLRINVMDK